MNWKYFLVFIVFSYAFTVADPPYNNRPNSFGGRDPVIDFTLKDTTGKIVNLHDFIGKFVIISMEANWCGPCLAEVKPTKDLQEYFLGKNIVWLFVSFERDEKAWAEARQVNQLPGVHLYGKPESETLKKLFQFNRLPYYIWVDKNGSVAETDAPRPSSGTAKKELKLYVK